MVIHDKHVSGGICNILLFTMPTSSKDCLWKKCFISSSSRQFEFDCYSFFPFLLRMCYFYRTVSKHGSLILCMYVFTEITFLPQKAWVVSSAIYAETLFDVLHTACTPNYAMLCIRRGATGPEWQYQSLSPSSPLSFLFFLQWWYLRWAPVHWITMPARLRCLPVKNAK